MRLRLAIALAAVTIVLGAPAASAQQYPPAAASVTCPTGAVQPGTVVTCTATGFLAGTTVSFSFGGRPVGSVTAGAVARLRFTVPDVAAGTYTVSADGTGADGEPLTVSTTVTVAARPGGPPGDGGTLPATGAATTLPLARVGGVAVVTGVLLVYAAGKRRRATRVPA